MNLGIEGLRASPPMPGHAVVLRIKPSMASRPFGPSLTPPRCMALRATLALLGSAGRPSPPRCAWHPSQCAEQTAPDRHTPSHLPPPVHRSVAALHDDVTPVVHSRITDRTGSAAWRTPHARQPPPAPASPVLGGVTAALCVCARHAALRSGASMLNFAEN